ncbi:MAG TPA: substrate-binding domain-containing protein [Castellaniella sp.]|nr:substrate-binding domain-containing protein [Castellaniella sp.]
MATRQLLAQLTGQYERDTGQRVTFESVGGVTAEKRILGGEPFDVIMLASGAMERLAAAGKIDRDSLVGVVNSSIAVAMKIGTTAPDIRDERSIRDAAKHARAIGYSTGPSGKYILGLLEKWGVAAGDGVTSPRLVEARPGVPVGSLVASGEVDIGFQQISELMNVEGINLLGLLPDSIQKTTTFSAAMGSAMHNPEATQVFLKFLVSPAADPAKAANGMTAA